jgi:integrase/recombinase XerD
MKDKTDFYQSFEMTLRRRAYSEKTVEAYMANLRQLNSHFPSKSIENLSLDEIKKFFDILITRKRASVSALYVAQSAFALFYDDILQKSYNIRASIKLPKRTRPIPEILSPNEVIALLNSTESVWQKLVFALIYGTGMEISEAVSVRWGEIDLQNKVIQIKQGRGKTVLRQASLSDYLCKNLSDFKKTYKRTDWLFENQEGNHASVSAVQKSFKQSLRLAGITKNVTVKSLRYSHVKHLEYQGVPLRSALLNLGIYSGQSVQLFSEIDSVDIIVPDPLDFLLDGKSFKIAQSSSKLKHFDEVAINLEFIKDADLLEVIRRDIDELNIVLSQGLEKAVKTCMVLCGSIAETMLLDSLFQREAEALSHIPKLTKKISNNLADWDLYDMVSIATHLDPPLLPEDAISGASQLRQWRNFIHPGRELKDAKKRIKPSVSRASNAIGFMKFIADELNR